MHAVRVRPDGSDTAPLVVGNLHASNVFHDPDVPRAEVERARAFVEGKAAPGEAIVLAGDFNVADPRLPATRRRARRSTTCSCGGDRT